MKQTAELNDIKCFHCSETSDEITWFNDKPFCCSGCQTVYEILNNNNLCAYYDLDKNPGLRLKNVRAHGQYDPRKFTRRMIDDSLIFILFKFLKGIVVF